MSLKDQLEKAFPKKHPEKKELHPPPPVRIETSYEDIDFTAIANSTEFRRLVYLIYMGKTHRGKDIELRREIKETQQAVEVVKELGRGSKADYREVMKELKERLKEVV